MAVASLLPSGLLGLLAGEEGGATNPLFSVEPEGQKFVGGNAKWVDPLFPWSNGDGEWGVGNIEVVLPSNNPGEEVGDPQAGDVDKRPEIEELKIDLALELPEDDEFDG